jgi:type IV pilus assembly protein PilQ
VKKTIKVIVLFLGFVLSVTGISAQDRFTEIQNKLRQLSNVSPGLNENVELSVNGVAIQEFIRGIATSNNLNVSVDASLDTKIINNFSNVTVADVFVFLCRKYDLDINFVGSIMSFVKYIPPTELPTYTPRKLKITYDKYTDNIDMDLKGDSLALVAKELTRVSQNNVMFSSDLSGKMLNAYIEGVSFKSAMDKLAFANDLKITMAEDNVYLIEKKGAESAGGKSSVKADASKGFAKMPDGANLKIENGLISLTANNAPILDVIGATSEQLKYQYFLFSDLKGNITGTITNATYEEFLHYIFNGTDFTFKKEAGIYLLGDRNLEGLRSTKVIQLNNRTVDKTIDIIPADLKKGVDIKPFPDLNGIIVSGSQPRIAEIETFIRQIDRVVPVIDIEVIIVDVNNSHTLSTGIESGLGTKPAVTGGTVFPGVDMTLSASAINELIDGINGFGGINLGKVTPNFYLKLKLLEQQGLLKMRSTPKLATLNGHEAKMSIGTTEYYLEIANNVIGSQNPQNIISQQYKSVNADLSVTINPTVSGDNQITLDIGVKQSNFTARISPSAPPGTITRDYKSLIRIKNEEMIILGGLEENKTEDSGSGVPLLSRIPVIKWLFSSRTKTKKANKLTIFIKATVRYS